MTKLFRSNYLTRPSQSEGKYLPLKILFFKNWVLILNQVDFLPLFCPLILSRFCIWPIGSRKKTQEKRVRVQQPLIRHPKKLVATLLLLEVIKYIVWPTFFVNNDVTDFCARYFNSFHKIEFMQTMHNWWANMKGKNHYLPRCILIFF